MEHREKQSSFKSKIRNLLTIPGLDEEEENWNPEDFESSSNEGSGTPDSSNEDSRTLERIETDDEMPESTGADSQIAESADDADWNADAIDWKIQQPEETDFEEITSEETGFEKKASEEMGSEEIASEETAMEEFTAKEQGVQERKRRHQKEARKAEKKPKKKGGSFWGGILIVFLVAVIAFLGYEVFVLQKENQQLKAELDINQTDEKTEKTENLFAYIKIGDNQYQLLSSLSQFSKDGWKLKALRTEKAVLVSGGKLEKDAYIEDANGRKAGIIIRNLSDGEQTVSDCTVTKLSFDKKTFADDVLLPNQLGFSSKADDFKKYGFKEEANNTLKYSNPDVQGEYIEVTLDAEGKVTNIVIEKESNDQETSSQDSNDQETSRQETNSQETSNQETSSQETNSQESNSQETSSQNSNSQDSSSQDSNGKGSNS